MEIYGKIVNIRKFRQGNITILEVEDDQTNKISIKSINGSLKLLFPMSPIINFTIKKILDKMENNTIIDYEKTPFKNIIGKQINGISYKIINRMPIISIHYNNTYFNLTGNATIMQVEWKYYRYIIEN